MKKVITILGLLLLSTSLIFAQSDDELFGSDDDLFGTEEDMFGSDDDMFSGDGIEEITDTSAKNDLAKGILFESGAVTVGGSFKTGIETNTKIYNPDEKVLGENIHNSTLLPILSAFLTVDARPTETLRMYTKFGVEYPFVVKAGTTLWGETPRDIIIPGKGKIPAGTKLPAGTKIPVEDFNPVTKPKFEQIPATIANTTISDWLSLKELFTDFSIADRAFFRFGLHTVSWGTGYFFSPVSDMINTSSIDPENPTEQVSGALNLRTQIIFPGSQNCLWFYVIPSMDFKNVTSAESYARDTGLAGKFDLVVGDWELGFGTFWKYQNPFKIMVTASGSIKKLAVFGEAVYAYGGAEEWKNNKDLGDKSNIFYATVGGRYTWKDPGITLAAQYFYDGNDVDLSHRIYTNGHNVAVALNFSKIGKIEKLSANIFGIANFGRVGFNDVEKATFESQKIKISNLPCLIVNGRLNYAPTDNIRLYIGPGMTFSDFKEEPIVSLKIGATLGGGKF